ncbi:hypothetical protein [Dokdonella sp.]|uniref:hypothetical protein n=1 Tax=Dokdonella sp. TaxID=2291710 RepID=UPI0037850E21
MLIASAVLATAPARACRHKELTPDQALAAHDYVFLAHVDELLPATPLRYESRERTATIERAYARSGGFLFDQDEWTDFPSITALGDDASAFARVSVARVMKGDIGASALVLNDVPRCMFGTRFALGSNYLVFADKSPSGGYLRAARYTKELSGFGKSVAGLGHPPAGIAPDEP